MTSNAARHTARMESAFAEPSGYGPGALHPRRPDSSTQARRGRGTPAVQQTEDRQATARATRACGACGTPVVGRVYGEPHRVHRWGIVRYACACGAWERREEGTA